MSLRAVQWTAAVLVASLVLAACGSARKPSAAPASGPTTVADFVEQFRKAFESRDADAVLAFWCWDGNTPEDRAEVREQVVVNFEPNDDGVTMASFLMGRKNGVLLVASAAPVDK